MRKHLADADALVVRSAVQVTPECWRRRPNCASSGARAWAWTTSIFAAATAAGVLVMNTPGGNAVSVAEHTIALMLSMARSIPQASASTKSGKWEKKKFLGSELRGKTLGIDRAGQHRPRGGETRARFRDADRRARSLRHVADCEGSRRGTGGARRTFTRSRDYITVHVSLTPETERLLNKEAFAQMKKGVRIVNCARGELIDEEALKAGHANPAKWPAPRSMFSRRNRPTPGIRCSRSSRCWPRRISAASTEEAQEIVGVRIAEQMVEYLQNGIAINAVNMPALSPEQYKSAAPLYRSRGAAGEFRGASG